ncbi:MAG: L-aspartate oxidase [Actinobacteria bacterium]|nr:L-aspartate oxidase [Actinomycetota bacterium]
MTASFDRVLSADAVVVGSGVAGLTAALELAPLRVVLLTKGPIADGSTPYAQGGIAAAVGEGDSPAAHAADTLDVGGGLNDGPAVDVLTAEGPDRITDLMQRGVGFDRRDDGSLVLGREAGHDVRRILHADGDATGAEISRALVVEALAAGHIEVVDHSFAADLVVDAGRVAGLTARVRGEEQVLVVAPAVVLATGGIGRLYANTTNPPAVTGDGLAMSARAGVRLRDVEFVQFHPTALATGRDPMSLLTEALRGEGAVLLDEQGRRFMLEVHPDAELAPRDIVARANWRVLQRGGTVYLDATEAVGDRFPERFPTVYHLCREDGIDPRVEPMPAAPAAHYHMGGIATDLFGRTSLPGLWAAGEAARTGVHGANRLASNSLLEGTVFGRRVAIDIKASGPPAQVDATALRAAVLPGAEPAPQPDVVEDLRDVMWDKVGLIRRHEGLMAALEEIDRLDEKLEPRVSAASNMVTAARIIASAALLRTESRGGHFREDFPESTPWWQRPVVVNP